MVGRSIRTVFTAGISTPSLNISTVKINSNASEINDMTVGISFPKGLTPFGKTILEKSENVTELEKRISMEFGKPMRIKYIQESVQDVKNVVEENPIETFAQDLDLPFNVIEE